MQALINSFTGLETIFCNPLRSRLASLSQNLEKVLNTSNTKLNESKKRSVSSPVIRLKEIPDRMTVD